MNERWRERGGVQWGEEKQKVRRKEPKHKHPNTHTRTHTWCDRMICQQQPELVKPVGPQPPSFSITREGGRSELREPGRSSSLRRHVRQYGSANFPKVHQIQQPKLCFIGLFEVFHPSSLAGALVTSRVVHMHEEHVLVSVQDGVELRGRRGRDACRHVKAFGMDGGAT